MQTRCLPAAAALLFFATGPNAQVTLSHVGRDQSPSAKFESGAAEIVAHDKPTRRIFVVDAQEATVDVLNATDPAHPVKVGRTDLKAIPGVDPAKIGAANRVAARDGLPAVAVEAEPKTDPGLITCDDTASDFGRAVAPLKTVATGAQPDAVAFSNTGHFVVSAEEGEPAADVDPEGSVTIVDVRKQAGQRRFTSCTANLRDFDSQRAAPIAAGVVIDPAAARVAQDLEPEFVVAIGNNACVTLQEANAIAVVQLNRCRVSRIMPLGFEDHGLAKNSLDTSDREICSSGRRSAGQHFARQGPALAAVRGRVRLGRRHRQPSERRQEPRPAELTCPASASDCSARPLPKQACNGNHANDSAGSEPGESNETIDANGTCADATPNPAAGDLGPEGLAIVCAEDSPNGRPLLIVGNEASISTSIFEIVPKP